ncbi:MAG: DUF5665 domain-containing protein [Syntrophomonas sp.]
MSKRDYDEENEIIKELSDKVGELSTHMDKMRLAEYIDLLEHPRRLLYINFLVGIARGFGTAIGFTILAAIVVYLMQKIVILNMPIIGSFIADLVRIVQQEMNPGRTF